MNVEYLAEAGTAALLTVLAELTVLRTGLFRRRAYWVTLAIVYAFQVPVDGWLTRLDAPTVTYAPWALTGIRVPWNIPVEDFLFGFTLVTVTLLLWEHHRRAEAGR